MTLRMGLSRTLRAGLMAAACVLATGCRHKQVAVKVPILPPQPVLVDTTATAKSQPMIAPEPIRPVPLTPVIVASKKVKKIKRPTPVVVAPAPVPVQVASAKDPNLIGELTPGGSDAPQLQREAQELIGSLERRVSSLPQKTKDNRKVQLMQVRNFQRDAQAALNAGDAEGAVTLATKAKLLLDEMVK